MFGEGNHPLATTREHRIKFLGRSRRITKEGHACNHARCCCIAKIKFPQDS